MRKFDFYSDPGHGWLKVKRKELAELGIESQISGYSYQKGDAVYLEEDSDAPKFADAWEKKHRAKFTYEEHFCNRSSQIRTYQPFKPTQPTKEQITNEVQHQLMGVDGWQEIYADAPSEEDIRREMAGDTDKERKEQK